MSEKFVEYDLTTGRILSCGEVPAGMAALQDGNVWLGSADPAADYMVGGKPVARPRFGLTVNKTAVHADCRDELVIGGLPAGVAVQVYGPVQSAGTLPQAGEVALTFGLAGKYVVRLDLFPYITEEVQIDAN